MKCDEIPESLLLTEGQEKVQEQSIRFDQCSSPEKTRKVMAADQCSVEEILTDKTNNQDGDKFVITTLPQLVGDITRENVVPLPPESFPWQICYST